LKPPPFEYFEAATVDEAIELLAAHGEEARLLAGGQSLMPLLNFRLLRPACLIDLNRIGSLAYVREHDGGVALGAMTRQRAAELSPLVQARAPLLAEALRLVAHPAIRTRGTIGGSLAHADPAAELPAVIVALGGTLAIQGAGGRRELAASDFFRSYLATALTPDEVLAEVRIPPLPPRTGSAFLEISRRLGDFALVGLAAVLTVGADGTCASARLVFTGVGPVPTVARQASRELAGQPVEAALDRAAAAAADELTPDSDIHASAGYRRQVAGVLTRRALRLALARARAARE
jgi:aerobic carbon-monoxide dehydrogenase medium subunit